MTKSQLNRELYEELKEIVKVYKFRLSAEHDLYKKSDPYFLNAFYFIGSMHDGKVDITLEFSIKYHRFDELQYGIINPAKQVKFTDKLRANSGAMCRAVLVRMEQTFSFDGFEESIPRLGRDIMEFIHAYFTDFLKTVAKEHGSLADYYIANREKEPRLAALAYLDKGWLDEAAECFAHPNMDGENEVWSVKISTDEQRRRAQSSGMKIFVTEFGESIHRSRKEQFADFSAALQNGLEWNTERAMYGLLPEEREADD